MYVILPLVGYFGSHHCGLAGTEVRETTVLSTTITASLRSTPVKITTTADLRQEDESKTVGNFETEAILAISQMSTVQTSTLEIANISTGDSRMSRATERHSRSAGSVLSTTLHIYSPPTLADTSSVTVNQRPGGGIKDLIEPSLVALLSLNLLSTSASNSTVNSPSREVDVNDVCTTEACDTYVTRWVDFYLNVSNKKCINTAAQKPHF